MLQTYSMFRFCVGILHIILGCSFNKYILLITPRLLCAGTIFSELVEPLDQDIDPNVVFSWFHANITKAEAIDMLIKGVKEALFCLLQY